MTAMLKFFTFFMFVSFATLSVSRCESPVEIEASSNFTVDQEALKNIERLCTNLWANYPVKQCIRNNPKPNIEFKMDEIQEDDRKIPSRISGVRASLSGEPEIVPGKFGNAVFLPNYGTYDNNYVFIDIPMTECVSNLHSCKEGLTVSLWFSMEENTHGWPVLISSRDWQIWTHHTSDKFEPYLTFFQSYDQRYVVSEDRQDLVNVNEWHHVAFAYRNDNDVKFFIDGKLIETEVKFDRIMSRRDKPLQIGCHFEGNCARGKFDNLQIWEFTKSEQDIMDIYKEGECM